MEPKRIVDPNFPYTKSSDIYSYGVLMWEISSGHPPFENKFINMNALALAINNGIREDTIKGTPKHYKKLYKKCWGQIPEQRPTVEEVLKEFSKMRINIESTSFKIMDIEITDNSISAINFLENNN